eukprot:507299-Pleurochrysis_carterae.AAC.1
MSSAWRMRTCAEASVAALAGGARGSERHVAEKDATKARGRASSPGWQSQRAGRRLRARGFAPPCAEPFPARAPAALPPGAP